MHPAMPIEKPHNTALRRCKETSQPPLSRGCIGRIWSSLRDSPYWLVHRAELTLATGACLVLALSASLTRTHEQNPP